MNRYVIIVAGGKGLRMGGDLPKQFIPMRGKPLLMHTLEAFHRWDAATRIVLVLPEDHRPYWEMLCREIGCKVPHAIVKGGDTRFHSVKSGLEWVLTNADEHGVNDSLVAIHDGVRPFVTPEVITACFDQAAATGAAIPVLPMIDSIREIGDTGDSHPVDRSRYVSVQTPQVFALNLLARAYQQPCTPRFTDDASVVESLGHPVTTVPGNRENIKITTPLDLLIAQAIFENKEQDMHPKIILSPERRFDAVIVNSPDLFDKTEQP